MNLTSFTVKVINWFGVLLIMVKALVLYHSQQYGNTEKMAKAVASARERAGYISGFVMFLSWGFLAGVVSGILLMLLGF
jgi:hypothetical protein